MKILFNKNTLIASVMLIISVTLGVYTFNKVPLVAVSATVAEIGSGVLWWILLILTLMTGFHAARWLLMCEAVLPFLPRRTLVYNLFLGIFLNQTLPLGGDAARIAHLTFRKTPFSQSVICLLFDKLFALLALFFIAFTALFLQQFFAPSSLLAKSAAIFIVPIVLGVVGAIILLFILLFWRKSIHRFLSRYHNFMATFFVNLVNSLDLLIKNASRTILCFFFAVGVQCFTCSIALVVIFFANWNFEPLALFSTVAFVLILAYLPISLAGWGVRETGFILIAPYVGIADAQALVVALIVGSSQLIQGLTCGVFVLLPSLKVFRNDSPD